MKREAIRYETFAEADKAEDEYYRSLTADERVNLLLELVEQYGDYFSETPERFERVYRVVTLEES